MRERIPGRDAELQRVGALLADDAPTARALVLTGEAGVGKTTIWEEGVRLAGERGLRVLAARPAQAEVAMPFAALGDLLGSVVDAIELPAAAARRARSGAPARAAGGTGGLDEAVRAGVLGLDGDRVRFSHLLPAAIAYSSAAPWERRSAHRRLAGAALDADERAQQLSVAVEQPDERVASELESAAGAAASRGAPETAARLAERAAVLTPAGGESRRRRRLAVAAEHHVASGDPSRARAILDSLVAALPAGPERWRGSRRGARRSSPRRTIPARCTARSLGASGRRRRRPTAASRPRWYRLRKGRKPF